MFFRDNNTMRKGISREAERLNVTLLYSSLAKDDTFPAEIG